MIKPLRVLVVGCGYMGSSHAAAYHEIEDYEIVGLVSRSPQSRDALNKRLGSRYALFSDLEQALKNSQPDVVSINTYPDTHEQYAVRAFEAGCHIFLEKPAATTIDGCHRVIDTARRRNRKLVVGYILRHHPSWVKFVEAARSLGKPLVMRMNLNRQSSGQMWESHKNLMNSVSPIVDSGVHYVDIMCQMTCANPVRVSAIGARLSGQLIEGMYNYGQLQVTFDDGSVGWFEAGWGPMISETALSAKDVVGPKGSISMVDGKVNAKPQSNSTDSNTQTGFLVHHFSELDSSNRFTQKDDIIHLTDKPDHKELCKREQQFLIKAIREDLDLTDHMNDTLNSLRIVLAADESIRIGKVIELL